LLQYLKISIKDKAALIAAYLPAVRNLCIKQVPCGKISAMIAGT